MNVVDKYLMLAARVDQSKVVDFGKQTDSFYALTDFIDTLSHVERILIRVYLESENIPAPRSLYYDYKKQQWI